MGRQVVCEVHGLSYDADQTSCPSCRTTTAGLQAPSPPASRRDTQRREAGEASGARRDPSTTRRMDPRTVPGSRRPSQLDTQRRLETKRPPLAARVKPVSVPPGTRLHGLLAIGSLALVAVVAYRQHWEGPTEGAVRSSAAAVAAEPASAPPSEAHELPPSPSTADTLSAPRDPGGEAGGQLPLIRYRGRRGEVPEICRVSWLDMYGRKVAPGPNDGRDPGQTRLMVAAKTGSLVTLQQLLDQGSELVDARDALNHTALMYAAEGGRTEHVLALMRAGADARTRGLWDARGGSLSALDAALLARHSETAQRIQQHVLQSMLSLTGPDLAALDEAGETPLHWLARHAGPNVARVLLERGADPEAQSCPARPGDENGAQDDDPHSATPLLLAAWAENPAVARLLLEFKANARAVDERGRGVFHLMRHATSLSLTPDLLRAGADPMLPDRNGKTALDLVAKWGLRAELLQALAAANHPVGGPPATLEDLFGVLRRLAQERKGADPSPAPVLALLERDALLLGETDAQGRTPLFEAGAQGLCQVAETLVSRGARLDARDRAGRSPLHGARDADTVRLFVRLGANIDARDTDGRTPLLLRAATPGSLAAVSALVDAGANPRLLDRSQRGALQLARASGSPDVVAYLETQL